MKRYVAFGEMIADRWRGFVVQCYQQLCEGKQTVSALGPQGPVSITVSHGHGDTCCA